jgi:hypothetical protein
MEDGDNPQPSDAGHLSARQVLCRRSKNVAQVAAKARNLQKEANKKEKNGLACFSRTCHF